MLNVKTWKRVHLIGIGGINMSAVAKLLVKSGHTVTGSDVKTSEATDELIKMGIKIAIGPHDERNLPNDAQAVVHTSAAPESNPERLAAKARNLPDITNFEWLGSWFKGDKVVLVTGTHGKSTTTAVLGKMCEDGGLDPTVVVGSRLSEWPDGNLRVGKSDLVIIEGDEYAKHFLEFSPAAVIVNNIELDHTDVYKDLDDIRKTFEKLLHQAKKGGTVVANGESDPVRLALKPFMATNVLKTVFFGDVPESVAHVPGSPVTAKDLEAKTHIKWEDGQTKVRIEKSGWVLDLESNLLGRHNGMNVAAAALMAHELGAEDQAIKKASSEFNGIWRRMELLTERDGVKIFSDYGHHPTAVSANIQALREAFPDKRLVLCFQPHHKNRTKQLFDQFAACFDRADVLILCEIYDVAGRDADGDADMSSQKLLDAVKNREMARPLTDMEYAPDPATAVKRTLELIKPGDVCVFMGAGDMDGEVRRVI